MPVARRIAAAALVLILNFASELTAPGEVPSGNGRYFAIEVVDEQTGRGVPLVELRP